MINVSLSPSSIRLYNESQLLFYYQYIKGEEEDTVVPQCYGVGGTIVHEVIEQCCLKEANPVFEFEKRWKKEGMSELLGLNGKPLNASDYLKATLSGIDIIKDFKDIVTEQKIKREFMSSKDMNVYVSGVIDLQYKHEGDVYIIDWKTSGSIDESGAFEIQAKMYCYLIYTEYDIIPKSVTFEYLKINKQKVYSFSEQDLIDFGQYLESLAKEIIKKGDDITKYDIGCIDSPFNAHMKKCMKEIQKRKGENNG